MHRRKKKLSNHFKLKLFERNFVFLIKNWATNGFILLKILSQFYIPHNHIPNKFSQDSLPAKFHNSTPISSNVQVPERITFIKVNTTAVPISIEKNYKQAQIWKRSSFQSSSKFTWKKEKKKSKTKIYKKFMHRKIYIFAQCFK